MKRQFLKIYRIVIHDLYFYFLRCLVLDTRYNCISDLLVQNSQTQKTFAKLLNQYLQKNLQLYIAELYIVLATEAAHINSLERQYNSEFKFKSSVRQVFNIQVLVVHKYNSSPEFKI